MLTQSDHTRRGREVVNSGEQAGNVVYIKVYPSLGKDREMKKQGKSSNA